MLLLLIINVVVQLRWCGWSTWPTPTGPTGTRQMRHRLNRRPKTVSLCLIASLRREVWTVSSRLSLCSQPYLHRLPPVCPRTMEASPPPGSASRNTSWGTSSPPSRPGGRSRRCPLADLLLKTTMKRVSSHSISCVVFFPVFFF